MDGEFLRVPILEEIERSDLFGNLDCNIKAIEEETGCEILQREDCLLLRGGDDQMAKRMIGELQEALKLGERLDEHKVSYILDLAKNGESFIKEALGKDIICFTTKGKPVKAKTIGQKEYIKAMNQKEIVFAIGPAGTGKTYLAVAQAVKAFKNKEVDKIILTRPAVEAGERLGFLPGDLQDKVDPYLRPLYDALYDIMGRETALRLKEKEAIEVVPLAYMRGRTLDNAFIILDEAQNTTGEQMKMFLTRMGFGSRMIITGDITQIDLPKDRKSGLLVAMKVLKNVSGLSFVYLAAADVVRHKLVKRIIRAYDEYFSKKDEKH